MKNILIVIASVFTFLTCTAQEYYAITATTNNDCYQQNLNLKVEADCYNATCTVKAVEIVVVGDNIKTPFSYCSDKRYSLQYKENIYYFKL